MNRVKNLAACLACTALLASPVLAQDKKEVVIYTLQFGSTQYTEAQALETVFSESSDKIVVKAQETPGAMYITRFNNENAQNYADGKITPPMSASSPAIMEITRNGYPPFDMFPTPDQRILFSVGNSVLVFVTFDDKIKTPSDMSGKKVGFAEKSRPFMSSQPNEWLFDRGYGNWSKVNWQYLGTSNSKDALLNNRIDVHWTAFVCDVDMDENGQPYVTKYAFSPDMMEIVNSGRKVYYVNEDPAIWESVEKQPGDLLYKPIRIPAGTLPGQDTEIWARFGSTAYNANKHMPDDIVKELIRLRVSTVERLKSYHDMFSLYPENPYPLDAGLDIMHPAAVGAIRELGYPVPEK